MNRGPTRRGARERRLHGRMQPFYNPDMAARLNLNQTSVHVQRESLRADGANLDHQGNKPPLFAKLQISDSHGTMHNHTSESSSFFYSRSYSTSCSSESSSSDIKLTTSPPTSMRGPASSRSEVVRWGCRSQVIGKGLNSLATGINTIHVAVIVTHEL